MLAPPLLVSFSSIDDYLSALSPELREEYGPQIRDLYNRGLPPVVSARCLATLFGFSTKFVNAMVHRNVKYYREFYIPKGKRKRKIQAPKVALKVIQKWFGHHLAQAINFQDYLFGFIPGRSTIGAAARHCGSKWVYSIDIHDFFPSTPSEVVAESLVELGYSQKACKLIVPLCCYGDNLAQGAPSSPVLSNMAMRRMDEQLQDIASEFALTYTRYADDMVFSGEEGMPDNLAETVAHLFSETCWSISKEKTHLAEVDKGHRLKVHGLLVHGDRPRLTKGYRNRIRAYNHLLRSGNVREEDVDRIMGHINYARSVDEFQQE